MFSVYKSVSSFTFSAIVLFLFSIGSLEGYQPLIHLPVAPLFHYTNPVLFQNPALLQPQPLAAPVEVTGDPSSNIVRVLIHKEFKLQPNGEYRGITGETTQIIVPREEADKLGERGPRRISPANSYSGYSYKSQENSFLESQDKVSQNYEQDTKSEANANPGKENGGYENSDGGDTNNEEQEEENTNNDEYSEEATEDEEPSDYNDKRNTKKDLQKEFVRSPNEKITSKEKISDAKTTDKPDIDIELLHSLSEQFLLSNGKLTQLNASDFVEVNKENDELNGYYNYNVDDESKTKYGSGYNSSESTDPLNSKEENEEHSAPSTENKSYNTENENREEEGEDEYKEVVKSIIEQHIRPMRLQRENEMKMIDVNSKENYARRQVTPKPNFDFRSIGVNSRLQNSLTSQERAQLPQNLMRQKLNLVQQIQSYNNQPSNFTYNDARNFKSSSPSFGYNSPSESQQQEADELSVFLFDAPRFSSFSNPSVFSPRTTQKTFNEIPTSYTRRPLKLQREPLIKSHFDRTLYKNLGNTVTTTPRPTKSSRILFDDNEWKPITSRSNIESSVPEKLRQINSLTKTNSKLQVGSKTSSERITPNFNSFSSVYNKTRGNGKSATSHPVSIQDIIRGQNYESRPESREEGLNYNQSGGNGNKPLFHLIDELTGVIKKHKDAATSSEEALTKSNPKNFLNRPPLFPTGSQVNNNNNNFPRLNGDTNVNNFRNFSTSFRDVRHNTTSSNQVETINNSTTKEKQAEKLYYYSNDSRGTTPSPNGRVKTLMAVRPYVPPHLQEKTKPKSPFHAFLNSLHALHEKNKNRQSHFHEHIVNKLNLRQPKTDPNFKLTPSIFPARPIYKVEPIPVSQSPFPRRNTPQFVVSPVNSEIEVVDPANINRNPSEKLTRGFSRAPEISQPIKSPGDTKPKEYLGDKYTRLSDNLFYRLHHIFKQFVPPILHVGSNEPPK